MEFVFPIREQKDVTKMLKHFKPNKRNYLMFTIGISSALRIGDILRLKLKDVYDGHNAVKTIVIYESKTRKRKEFPVTPLMLEAIKAYVNTLEDINPEQYLFLSRKGEMQPITTRYADYLMKTAAKSCGIKERIGSHSMRKTWAYQAWVQGVPLLVIMEALNHVSLRDTRRYIGLLQEDLNKAYIAVKYKGAT